MTLELLDGECTVCQIDRAEQADLSAPFTFLARTEAELSLVCPSERAPGDCLARADGWRCFRVAGTLDFSLVGILAKISACLAEKHIAIFAVSTYNTDYVLLSKERLADARQALETAGFLWKETRI